MLTAKRCPTDGQDLADVHVIVSVGGVVASHFIGHLCGACRTIWSPTQVSDAIDLRLAS